MGTCKIVGWCDNLKCVTDGCLARRAVETEREACAKIAESCTSLERAWKDRGECVIAGAIRARSKVNYANHSRE